MLKTSYFTRFLYNSKKWLKMRRTRMRFKTFLEKRHIVLCLKNKAILGYRPTLRFLIKICNKYKFV